MFSYTQLLLASRQVHVPTVLGLVDMLLSFPVSSEAAFHGTKKRLRSVERINGGLLSIHVIATCVANPLKMQGSPPVTSIVNHSHVRQLHVPNHILPPNIVYLPLTLLL